VACFVLVHGAYHGGWCWRDVALYLRQAGHAVFTPTLTGLGERKHLLSNAITLETFVLDILHVLEQEDLHDVVLVGHSFGGRVICGVADRAPERIRRLVFLDAGLAPQGESRLDGLTAAARADRISAAQRHDGGLSVPPPPASAFGVTDPTLAAWLEANLTPQPFCPDKCALKLAHPLGNGLPASYVRCVAPALAVTEASAAYAQGREDWTYREFAGGHNAFVTHPHEIAELLIEEARRAPTS
jgi:pimeloyl-ACP methyl ester carboxylesterase